MGRINLMVLNWIADGLIRVAIGVVRFNHFMVYLSRRESVSPIRYFILLAYSLSGAGLYRAAGIRISRPVNRRLLLKEAVS